MEQIITGIVLYYCSTLFYFHLLNEYGPREGLPLHSTRPIGNYVDCYLFGALRVM